MDLFLSWFRRQACFVLSLFLSLFNEVFLNNFWLKSSASIFDDSQFGTEIPSNWICVCHDASCKQLGQKCMLDPKCVFAHRCTWVCQVRLGWRGSASQPAGWALGHSWGLLHCCVFRGLKVPAPGAKTLMTWYLFLRCRMVFIWPVLGINSLYLLWCWNNAFLQGEMNIEFAGKAKEKD